MIKEIKIEKSYLGPELKASGSNQRRNTREIVVDLLRSYPDGLRRSDITSKIGGYKKPQHASTMLYRMIRDGVLIKEGSFYKLVNVRLE